MMAVMKLAVLLLPIALIAAEAPPKADSSGITESMKAELFKAQRDYLLAERNAKAPMEEWEKTGEKAAREKITAATTAMEAACQTQGKAFDGNSLACVEKPKQSAAAEKK